MKTIFVTTMVAIFVVLGLIGIGKGSADRIYRSINNSNGLIVSFSAIDGETKMGMNEIFQSIDYPESILGVAFLDAPMMDLGILRAIEVEYRGETKIQKICFYVRMGMLKTVLVTRTHYDSQLAVCGNE